jgi:hypothetical protein
MLVARHGLSRKPEKIADNVIPFPVRGFGAELAAGVSTFLKLPDDERKRLCFGARTAGRSRAGEAFGLPPRLASLGAASSDDDAERAAAGAAIEAILDKLRGCEPGAQDRTLNSVAFQLGGAVKGKWPGVTEDDIKRRFIDIGANLRNISGSSKGDWTRKLIEEKWKHGFEEATARPWKKKAAGTPLDHALEKLNEAKPLKGTPGERYFIEARHVDPTNAMGAMRFNPAVSCAELGKGRKLPAILTPMREGPEGEVVSVHVTYLMRDGSKPDLQNRKKTFGKWSGSGAAIYLMPIGSTTVTAEGIEKAIKVHNVTGLPAIAAGNASLLGGMSIPAVIELLIICGDRGGDGEKNAEKLKRRALAAGIKVKLCYPPEGRDWDECADDEVRAAIDNAPISEPHEAEVIPFPERSKSEDAEALPDAEKKAVAKFKSKEIAKPSHAYPFEVVDVTAKGEPVLSSIANVKSALDYLGIKAWHNEFTSRPVIEGIPGCIALDNHGVLEVWRRINNLGLFVQERFVDRAVAALARERRRHPIRDWLDSLTWDRKSRLDTLFIEYAGAPDTPYNRALSKLLLVAMVRRVREPGVKFDHLILLRGKQNIGKSLLWQILAGGPEYFTDRLDFRYDSKKIVERTSGKWLAEVSEMKGLSSAEIGHTRGFVTCQVDRARLTYEMGTATDYPRQFVPVGTANEHALLHDQAGNRRFDIVEAKEIKFEKLALDREQIFAEANEAEKRYGDLVLPQEVVSEATAMQEAALGLRAATAS